MPSRTYISVNPTSRYKTTFPAVLLSADDRILESGKALASPGTKSVDFTSDFVPLFNMGTPLKIVRMFESHEIHRFTGEVYLSSERLLRITSVQDELLPNSEQYYQFAVDTPAMVKRAPIVQAAPPKKLFSFGRKISIPPETGPAAVTAITLDSIEFCSELDFEAEDRVLLSMESLLHAIPLERMLLEISRVLEFGPSGKKYTCRIVFLPPEARQEWDSMIRDLHMKNNKLF